MFQELTMQANPNAPLAGVKVIDLTHAYAGPFSTFHMAAMGADVLKIEAPGGDEFRHWREYTFAQANAGKRSMVLNLKSEQGLAVLDRLVAGADVVVENSRPGALEKLGITWERLNAINPSLIFCSISGFGQSGELRNRPAMEWSVQAMSGINRLYVEDSAEPTVLGLSILDPFAGYMAFAGVMAALLQRNKTGTGQRIDVSMFDAAWVLAASSVTELLQGITPVSMLPRPNSARFMCRDKRLFISFIWPKWFAAVSEVIGAPELLTDARFANDAAIARNGDALIFEIERCLAHRDAAEWAALLGARGVPASPVDSVSEAAEWPQVRNRNLLETVSLADGERKTEIVGSGLVFAHNPPRVTGGVPAVGSSTRAALSAAGFSQAEIDGLVAAGVVEVADAD
jgi:CoA:oxalate CoA-transferase